MAKDKKKYPNGGKRGSQDEDTVNPGSAPEGFEDKERPDRDDDDEPDDFKKSAKLDAALEKLEKAMDTLDPREARKNELLAKSARTRSEDKELATLLTGGEGDLRKSATSGLEEEDLHKSIDGSAYLEGMHAGLVEGLGSLADAIENHRGDTNRFNVAMAETMVEMGGVLQEALSEVSTLRKSVAALTERAGSRPAHAPRSPGGAPSGFVPRPMMGGTKQEPTQSAGAPRGGNGDGAPLAKSLVVQAIDGAMRKGVKSIGGRSIGTLSSMFSGGGEPRLPDPMYDELRSYLPQGVAS